MNAYWIMAKNSRSYPIKITVQAPSPHIATEQVRAMLGRENMISDYAALLS